MFIGTTGAGKTTELKKIVTQARERGHRCVIFDLTGTFVESFYDAETDIILNPMDRRCVPWSIFNDCDNYAEFMSAATALVPSGYSAEDDFWQKSARTLFVEMCVKMIKMGVRSNGALSYFLMQSDLKTIHAQLEGTIAGPMMSPAAAKMAESIRTTFIANANVFRFLPAPSPRSCAPRYTSGIAGVCSRVVIGPRAGPKPTTSHHGRPVATQRSTTWPCSAPGTTT